MRAGRLRELLRAEKLEVTHGAEGGPKEAPVLVAGFWARRVDAGGSDQQTDGERQPQLSITWEARYREDLEAGMEIVERSGRRHRIVGEPFDPDGRREKIQIETVRRG